MWNIMIETKTDRLHSPNDVVLTHSYLKSRPLPTLMYLVILSTPALIITLFLLVSSPHVTFINRLFISSHIIFIYLRIRFFLPSLPLLSRFCSLKYSLRFIQYTLVNTKFLVFWLLETVIICCLILTFSRSSYK